MQVAEDHWLKQTASGLPALTKAPSVRTNMLDAGAPAGIVWHWTGGICRGPNVPTILANEIRTYDKLKDRAASWHVAIGKDGQIVQSVAFNSGSWHVGRPGRIGGKPVKTPAGTWDPMLWPGTLHANINRATTGVELCNSGRLEKVGEKFYCWPFWLDPDKPAAGPDPKLEIEASRAVAHDGKFWDVFPEAQEMAATRLMQALVLKYKLPREVVQYGHVMFDPSRKEDPGPVWLEVVLPRIIDRVFGAE